MEIKKCTRCNIQKTRDQFFRTGISRSGKIKIRGDCKACASKHTSAWRTKNRSEYNAYMSKYRIQNPDKIRATEIKKLYGLLPEELLKMAKDQNNKCKICYRSPTGKRPLAIDHCHKTGKVRGLLCYRCNTQISILENPERLEKSIEYLKSFS